MKQWNELWHRYQVQGKNFVSQYLIFNHICCKNKASKPFNAADKGKPKFDIRSFVKIFWLFDLFMDLSFYVDCNGAEVDEETKIFLASPFLLVHNLNSNEMTLCLHVSVRSSKLWCFIKCWPCTHGRCKDKDIQLYPQWTACLVSKVGQWLFHNG